MYSTRHQEAVTEPNPNNPGSPVYKAKHPQKRYASVEVIEESNANFDYLVSLVKASNHRQSLMQRDIDELTRCLIHSTVYTFIDWEDRYIKIGWSDNFEKPRSGRKDTHLRAGLEYLAHSTAPKVKEDDLLKLLKTLHIEPRRGTREEFKVTKNLIEILVSQRWPLGDDPYSLLDDTRQNEMFSA